MQRRRGPCGIFGINVAHRIASPTTALAAVAEDSVTNSVHTLIAANQAPMCCALVLELRGASNREFNLIASCAESAIRWFREDVVCSNEISAASSGRN